jgi:transcriptional regulator with GAF, ATPase, and Fis domain
MDKNEFFRLATLSVCGSLQIETAMHECVCTIRNLIPIDRMYLMIYEPSLGAMRTLAMGSPKKGKKLDWLTPLPQAARNDFQDYISQEIPGAIIIDSPEDDLVAKEMLRGSRTSEWSVMCMTLSTQCGQLGQVALTAKGTNQYSKEHADLFSMLQNPFAIALANALRHREVIKLKDLLADDNRFLHGELRNISCVEIVGANVGLRDVMYKVRQVASLDSPVLLLGETGTGKDVIANAIHYSSSRSEGPFVSVNCGAIDPLTHYHWPGNVRELENVIERAIILNPKGPLTFEHLYPGQPTNVPVAVKPGKELTSLDEVISHHIHQTLSKTNGRISGSNGAAAVLKVNPSTLRNRMKKLGIFYEKR